MKFPYPIDLTTGMPNPRKNLVSLLELKAYPKKDSVKSEGRTLESIAFSIYGDTGLWPLLAEYNNIINPLHVPEDIYFPPKELVSKVLADV